jgi:hypothetical protein
MNNVRRSTMVYCAASDIPGQRGFELWALAVGASTGHFRAVFAMLAATQAHTNRHGNLRNFFFLSCFVVMVAWP